MEHVPGVQLSGCWDSMSSSEHLQIIKSISDMIGQMAALEFPAFGSIYFHDAPIDPALRISFDDGFCIGPHCNPVLWNRGPGESELYGNSGRDHGPCKSTVERHHCRHKLTRLPRAKYARVLQRTTSIGTLSHTGRRPQR
jgi:hypothetical protein